MTTGGNLSALMPVPEKTLRLKKIKTKHSKDTSEGALAVAPVLPSAVSVVDVKDKRSCCIYNRAFIEHISLLLEEPGAQEEVRDKLLAEGLILFCNVLRCGSCIVQILILSSRCVTFFFLEVNG